MKAYIVKTHKRIYPFMDSVSEVLIGNRTLYNIQVATLKKVGLVPELVDHPDQITDQEPYLMLYDNLCISVQGIRLVLRAAMREKESFRCAIAKGYYSEVYLWNGEENYCEDPQIELYYFKNSSELPRKTKVIYFECKKFERERMPIHMEANGRGMDYPLTNVLLLPINNWVNIWQANIGMLMKHAYELEYTNRLRQVIPIIRALGSKERAPMYLNKIGKNCNIHPSAVIEASVIGNNVHIGANAVVRLCNIADGAYISDQALLRVCCIGEKAYIANNNNLAFNAVYPEAFLISGPYQFSLFGRDCAIMHCIDCDCRLDGYTIKAKIGKHETIDSKQIYLGSCYGHRVRIGAGTISAPGSAVCNDMWINPNPKMVMNSFEGLPLKKNLFLSEDGIVTKDRLPVRC